MQKDARSELELLIRLMIESIGDLEESTGAGAVVGFGAPAFVVPVQKRPRKRKGPKTKKTHP